MKFRTNTSRRHAAIGAALVASLYACGEPSRPTAEQTPTTQSSVNQHTTPTAAPEDVPFVETPNNRARVRHLSLSMTQFTLNHELGHMVMREYGLPVLGGQEDAADRFATLLMTPPPRQVAGPPETFDPAVEPDVPGILWAVAWWRFDQRSQGPDAVPVYWGPHPLGEQRSYQVLCLVYGADPQRFEQTASKYLPATRLEECLDEARTNSASWEQVLAGQVMRKGELDARYNPVVRYNDAPEELASARASLMESRSLETFGESLRRLRVRPGLGRPDPALRLQLSELARSIQERSIPVIGDACQTPDGRYAENAFWDGNQRQIVFCYGLQRLFDQWARTTISRTSIGRSEAAAPR